MLRGVTIPVNISGAVGLLGFMDCLCGLPLWTASLYKSSKTPTMSLPGQVHQLSHHCVESFDLKKRYIHTKMLLVVWGGVELSFCDVALHFLTPF